MARPLRVLVVDDTPDIVSTTMELLRLEGYEVDSCDNGTDVLRCVRKFDPDIVLLDIELPGLSGWEVARRIRERATKGIRPVLIAITGEYTKAVDQILSEITGFNYYLVKPADPKVLMTLLAKVKAELTDSGTSLA
jgi:DNA-binding response OmpR family regulator